MGSTQLLGRAAEDKALAYLLEQGFKLVSRNYTCKVGEIDIIMRDGPYLVFIEVRARSNRSFGDGIASITYAKRQKIIKASLHFLVKHQVQDKYPLRFDIISCDGHSGTITWLKNAFGSDG